MPSPSPIQVVGLGIAFVQPPSQDALSRERLKVLSVVCAYVHLYLRGHGRGRGRGRGQISGSISIRIDKLCR